MRKSRILLIFSIAVLLVLTFISVSTGLSSPSRIIINDADFTRDVSNQQSDSLFDLVGNLSSRIIINYSDYIRRESLIYPRDLIADTKPPEIVWEEIITQGAEQVRVRYRVDEFVITSLAYGYSPGEYSGQVSDLKYNREFTFLIDGTSIGKTFYYQITTTDLSGNSSVSVEKSFTPWLGIYLPILLSR